MRSCDCHVTPPPAATQLANSMMTNKFMQHSLTCLDLSANPLGPDPQGALGFLKEPQTVATLILSNCGLNFEYVRVCVCVCVCVVSVCVCVVSVCELCVFSVRYACNKLGRLVAMYMHMYMYVQYMYLYMCIEL